MADFFALFQSLPQGATNARAIPACRAADSAHVWIGKDEAALPVAIVETTPDRSMPSPIVLRNLRFDPYLECSIEERPDGQHHLIHASVIRLTTSEPGLQEYFLRTMSVLLAEIPARPQVTELARAVDRLAEVFRALILPPATSLQGLWAELLLIRHAATIDLAVRSWHPTRRSLFDFEAGDESLEVKSSISGIRKHHFKLSQLRPPTNRRVYIASMLLTQSQSGPSIPDLWRAAESRLSGQAALAARLAEVIAQSAGSDWRHADTVRFDDSSALRSMLIFNADSIPRVGDDARPDVTEIEFFSDLSSSAPINRPELSNAPGLLAAVLPGRQR